MEDDVAREGGKSKEWVVGHSEKGGRSKKRGSLKGHKTYDRMRKPETV